MNLLFLSNVLPTPWRPHQGMFNTELIRALRQRGHSVRVVAPVPWTQRLRHPFRTWPQDATTEYPTFWYPPGILRASYDRDMWYSVRRSLLRVGGTGLDAVIAFWVHPDGSCAVRFGTMLGIPSIVIAGGSDLLVVTSDRSRADQIRSTLVGVAAVLAEGPHLVDKAVSLGIDPDRVHLFRRGVDSERFFPGDQGEARERLGLPATRPIVMWAGNMVPVKGVELLIAAHSQMATPRPLLVLIGDGPGRRGLETMANRLSPGEVQFVGRVPHAVLGEWFRAASLFALPSLSEGTPNVLQEAGACGVPFVATDVGAVSSLTTSADRVVPSRHPQEFARSMEDVLATPGPRHGKTPVSASWDPAIDRIEQVIRGQRSAV